MTEQPVLVVKPRTIGIATGLLWIAVALELVLAALEFIVGDYEMGGRVFGLALGLVFTLIAGTATFFFSQGRNWARIAILVLFVMGAVGLAAGIEPLLRQAMLVAGLSIAQLSLNGVALYLAFSAPGSSYFRGSPADDAAMRAILPVGRSGWAIAAGYLALFSVLLVPAPFALLCGVLAIRDIRRNPSKHGMGRAYFGLIMGSLGVIALLFLVWLRISR